MIKSVLTLVIACAFFITIDAQKKIFKEVSDDIETQTRPIIQDNSLVGYLVFTRLEKASQDSFNYKISLMDENLNDIGTINFREIGMDLAGVSFDQDVLCLAYLKSTTQGKVFKNRREAKKSEFRDDVVTQFLTLDGNIIKTNSVPVQLNSVLLNNTQGWGSRDFEYNGHLTHNIQLKNISGKGFACFFGDASGCNLIAYDLKGDQLWKKNIDEMQDFALLSSKSDIYLLEKEKGKYLEGGGSLVGFNFDDGKKYPKITMEDNEGRSLTLMTFGIDPVSGNPYICGNIINSKNGNKILNAKSFTKGPYDGVYTMDINGPSKKDIKKSFVYWKDGSMDPTISTRGYNQETHSYNVLTYACRDYSGNTYFIGSQLIRKVKIGTIISSVLTLPTVIIPCYILMASGTTKCKVLDASVMKLSPKGVLTLNNTIDCADSKFIKGIYSFNDINGSRRYYSLDNSGTKNNYIVVDDSKNIMIYGIAQQKIVRTIPHKNGNIRTFIGPAKDGHFMVIEYNKKEKYTSLSIEPLN